VKDEHWRLCNSPSFETVLAPGEALALVRTSTQQPGRHARWRHRSLVVCGPDRHGRARVRLAQTTFSEVQLLLLVHEVVELELKSPTVSGQRVVFFTRCSFLWARVTRREGARAALDAGLSVLAGGRPRLREAGAHSRSS